MAVLADLQQIEHMSAERQTRYLIDIARAHVLTRSSRQTLLTLARQCAALDKGQTLTDTDWSSLASLGPALEVGVARLYAYLSESLRGLDASDAFDKRAAKLASLVKRGEFVRTLELLLVAQQSEYLWQRIRLERVRTAEPDALQQTLTNTAELLAEHLASDRRLAHQLREVLSTYAVLRLSEVHHIFIGDRLSKARRTLGDGVDRFVELRTRQVANWDDLHDATLGDALRVASAQASKLATGARRGIASGAGAVARWVDPDDSAGPTTSAKPELNLAPGPIAPVRDEE